MKTNNTKAAKVITASTMVHASKLENPCQYVRDYLDKHFKKLTRSECIVHFITKGMATYTARTQYQKYYAKVHAPKVTKGKGAKKVSRKVTKPAPQPAPAKVAA